MSNFLEDNRFIRDDTTVKLAFNTNLGTCRPIHSFTFNCSTQEYAEMLVRILNTELDKFKKAIAKDAVCHLDDYEVSQLKKQLSDWNSKTNTWK